MGKNKESFGKKEVRNKQEKKRKEKEKKRLEKKEQSKNSFDDMIAWVDENGNLSSTQPDMSNKEEIDADSIEVSIPKAELRDKNTVYEGKLTIYDDSKGYGFIKCSSLQDSVFVHINDSTGALAVGVSVKFEIEESVKGMKAVNVIVL
jgi:cold shock CspA family protein